MSRKFHSLSLSCSSIAPIEGVGLIIWWIVEQIKDNPDTWWQITIDSLATVLTEWSVVMLVFIGLNWWMAPPIIYEPKGRIRRKVLGALFRLTPRPLPPTPPPAYTPKVVITVSNVILLPKSLPVTSLFNPHPNYCISQLFRVRKSKHSVENFSWMQFIDLMQTDF